jgi:hypothetical protein
MFKLLDTSYKLTTPNTDLLQSYQTNRKEALECLSQSQSNCPKFHFKVFPKEDVIEVSFQDSILEFQRVRKN